MKLKKFLLLTAIASIMFGGTACQSRSDVASNDAQSNGRTTKVATPGEGTTLKVGHSDWMEEVFVLEILNTALKELGYKIADMQQADYAALHVSIMNGDLDYTSFYDPTQLNMIEKLGGKKTFALVGEISRGQDGYLIDKATSEKYKITNIKQLQDPKLAQLFDSDGDGKANMAGCQVGWGCNETNNYQLKVYGLQDTVKQDEANYTLLLTDVLTRYKQGKPVLYYGSYPGWIFSKLKLDKDVVWLEVPFTALNGLKNVTEADTTVDGKNLGRLPVLHRIIANPKFIEANPVVKRLLEAANIPADDISAESVLIQAGENSPEDIRRHAQKWVEDHRSQVNEWLNKARQSAN